MDFTKLTQSVVDAQINRTKLTDLPKGTYSIELDPKSETQVFLVSQKKAKTPLGINALAGMRVVKSATDAAIAITTADARTAAGYSTLQDAVSMEGVKIDSNTKFEVVHRLRIKDVASGDFVYKNEHYRNYPEYLKASRKAAAIAVDTERATAFAEASDALRSGGLKSPAPAIEDKNLVLMPVFVVS